ncbi:MAG TPA: hypothetical protein VK474_11630 [Chthoniobacterales bacterium]|nr:hypothetical protein [Chthoniobacterales bacterium]
MPRPGQAEEFPPISLEQIAALRAANEAVHRALSDLPSPISPSFQIESHRVTVCRGFLHSCEQEIKRTLFLGRTASIAPAGTE